MHIGLYKSVFMIIKKSFNMFIAPSFLCRYCKTLRFNKVSCVVLIDLLEKLVIIYTHVKDVLQSDFCPSSSSFSCDF
jgi:hypothetical protein